MPKWNTAVSILAIAAFAPAAFADGMEGRSVVYGPAPLKAPHQATAYETTPQGVISGPDYRVTGATSRVVSTSGYSTGYTTGYAAPYSGGSAGAGTVTAAPAQKSIMTCATGRSSPADTYVECNNWRVTDRVVYREDFPVETSGFVSSSSTASSYSYGSTSVSYAQPAPAPVYHPAPAPQPVPVRTVSTTTVSDGFFTSMSGGVGRDIATGGFYGGGGAVFVGGGSTSVVARSPIPIVINVPRKSHPTPPPVHKPYPKKGGCGGCGH